MLLTISSFYSEPGYVFNISNKVDNFIRDKLKETIPKKLIS